MTTETGSNVTTRPPESVSAEVDSRRLASELAGSLRGEVRERATASSGEAG